MTVIIALVLLAPVLVDLLRRPTFRNLALRNISRRRGEAVLVIVGSMLGTAIITGSFVVGDTVEASMRDGARTTLGPVDEVVRLGAPEQAGAVVGALGAPAIAEVDGLLRVRSAGVVPTSAGEPRRAEPTGTMVEVDFDEARRFGADPAITGLADAGATPAGDEVVIGDELATTLRVGAGDAVELFAYGRSRPFRVRQVLPEIGLVGFAPARSRRMEGGAGSAVVFVPPGTIDAMSSAPAVDAGAGAAAPVSLVLVSNAGGVFDAADHTSAVVAEVTKRLGAFPGTQVSPAKADLLEMAKAQGASLTELFRSIGYFSVIAGILLLVNLFVMLAEERRSELGMLRALGFKRNSLVRTFAMEGAVYSVAASILGAVAGIGVGWAIIRVTTDIVNEAGEDATFDLAVRPASLVSGAALGLVICMVTVWLTSARIARLNIIRSIRELPEPRIGRRSIRPLLLGAVAAVTGVLAFLAGWQGDSAALVLAGPAVALFGLIFVLGRVLPRKPVTVACSLAALAWGIGVFTFASDKMDQASLDVFVVQGIVLVAAGVTVMAQADRLWATLAKGAGINGGGLASRLGLAYPLARKFRTALLLSMYSIVIFTMAFISVLAGIFGDQSPQFTDQVRGGFDLFVDSSPGNPVTADQLAGRPGVAAVAPLTRGTARARTARHPGEHDVVLTGFDESLLGRGQPALEQRAAAYRSDADVFRAVLGDPGLIIVNQGFASASQGGGPPQAGLAPGDTVTLLDSGSGTERTFTVAGVVVADIVVNGGLASAEALDDLLGPRKVVNRHYVRVEPGADADTVATAINGALVENGANARSFRSVVDEALATQAGFFGLLRAYLGLGLLIGIAGLGVVMVRAVRERRREIGMLRAIGCSAAVVRRAFILEAAFITLQGILLGIGLGMLTSYNLVVNSEAFGGQEVDFSWPWIVLAIIAAGPLVASLVATAGPATQAARIRPAVALRIAD